MTPERFAKLNPGDIVRGIHSGDSYVITGELESDWGRSAVRYIGTGTIVICTPEEWDLKQAVDPTPDRFAEWFNKQPGDKPITFRGAFEAGMKAEK